MNNKKSENKEQLRRIFRRDFKNLINSKCKEEQKNPNKTWKVGNSGRQRREEKMFENDHKQSN